MALLKAPFDGIGSGSGVAWPLFGLLMSALSLATGGTAAIVIGTIATFIFLAISIPIFYLSYQESLEETKRQDKKSIKYWTKLLDDIGEDNAILPEAVKTYLTKFFSGSESPNKSIDYKALTKLIIKRKIDTPSLPIQLDFSLLEQRFPDPKKKLTIKKQLIQEFISNVIPRETIPLKLILASALTGFVGAFGAIAGGGSGFLGLLTGLGLFAGVSAVPIVGWVVLGAAIIVGTILAYIVAEKAIEKFHVRQEIKLIKALDAIIVAHNAYKTTNNQIMVTALSSEDKTPTPAVTNDKNRATISPDFRKSFPEKPKKMIRCWSASDIFGSINSPHSVLDLIDVPNDEKNLNHLMQK